ncbi:MAG: ATP-dependent RNA helicase DbpA [Campylobacteraceae bacterium]|nr:ATP-dependent RNA helicase DbpA [Campylobacteraceae bacterium]
MISSTFKTLNIQEDALKNLDSLNYEYMTEIQEKTLPLILDGKDIIAQAKTGSGKTVSFSLPIILKLNVKQFRIQSLVLAPTRELASQVAQELRKLARYKHNVKILELCGGVPYRPQVNSLFHGAHILVGTPGRILKHLKEGNIKFDDLNTLVLDEADKMLDMGFLEDMSEIISYLPKQRQTLLFSATFEENIQSISKDIMRNPVSIKVDSLHNENIINEKYYKVENENKTPLISTLISTFKPESILIFCNMKIKCDEVADDLYDLGFDVLTLHSDLDQKQRDEVLLMFSNKSYPILIATDVASRGLDIDDISLVINYDLANDEKVHTHRIGRTARAGKKGMAITLCNSYDSENMIDYNDILNKKTSFDDVTVLEDDVSFKLRAPYRTIFVNGGKKDKVRAGDLLGALTGTIGLSKDDIGKINIFNFCSYVAIKEDMFDKALDGLNNNRIKGKYYKAYGK